MRFLIFTLFSTYLLLATLSSSIAQEINQQTAQEIKTAVQKLIGEKSDWNLEFEVTPQQDHYLLNMDDEIVDEKTNAKFEIKGYRGKYYPTDNPSQFEVESVLTKDNVIRIESNDNPLKGPEVLTAKVIGDYQLTQRALIDLDLGQYLSMNEVLPKTQITIHEGDVKKLDLTIDQTSLISKYVPTQSDTKILDGNLRFSLNGIKGQLESSKKAGRMHHVNIDEIVFDTAVRGLDTEKLKSIQGNMLAHSDEFSLLDLLSVSKISASKMDVNGIKVADEKGQEILVLDNIAYKGGMSDFNGDQAEMSFSTGFNGLLKTFSLSNDPAIASLKTLMPDNMLIKFKAVDVPVQSLANEFQTLAEANSSEEAKLKAKNMLTQNKDKIISMLANNKASAIFNFNLGGEDFAAELQSNLKADVSSPLNVLGDVTLQFFNMDDYLKRATEVAQSNKENPVVAEKLPKAMGGLMMLQMMGQQKTDPVRGDYREFKIVFEPDGNLTLNGAPLTQLMGVIKSQKGAE